MITVIAMVGIAGGAGASLLTPVQYQSSTRLYVSVAIAPGSSAGDLVQGNNFAIQKVVSYIEIVTSARVLEPVIAELGLDTTPIDLAEEVTAVVQPNSVVLQIDALAATAPEATALSTAVANSFTNVVVNELEVSLDGSVSPVKVEVIQPAIDGELPALPQTPLNLALGLAIGLFVGVLVAIIIGLLDRRIHGREDLERITDLPVLGSINVDSNAKTKPLIVNDGPRSLRTEAFRALRTNLQFVGVDGRSKTMLITSALPGEGKSTTLANLAIVLSENGSSVVLIDGDLRAPRLAEYMGLDGSVGLTDVLVGRAAVEDVLQPWGRRGRVVVLPAGRIPPNPTELLGSHAMEELLGLFANEFDYVLIDAPPILPVTDAAVLSRLTAGTLLVVQANRAKGKEVSAAIAAFESAGSAPIGIILTMVPTRGPDAATYGTYGGYAGTTPTAGNDAPVNAILHAPDAELEIGSPESKASQDLARSQFRPR